MTLNLFTDYSLRVLMYAALPGNERFSLDDVSSAYGISRDHIAKVVQFLVRHGYLATQRGRGGGISLARFPNEIRVGTVVRETEGANAILECFTPATNRCRLIGQCRLQNLIGEALTAFYAVLDRTTLDQIVSNPTALTQALATV